MNQAVILEAVRTPFGRRGGWWAETRPDSLLADTVHALLARAGLPGDKVEDLIAGCVSQAGEQGANIGRLAAMLAGLPERVPGVALNR
ncbi:thiolase family protein, partial [Achromobacter mucicolens]